MEKEIKHIVIVGGGSAGWLSAGVIAAQHLNTPEKSIRVTLIESPQINTIGVGEGTWPSMRNTLQKIGISELEFISSCDAAFKQGSKFINWRDDSDNDFYYHPFMTPQGYNHHDLHATWQQYAPEQPFADAINHQSPICQAGLAPKQLATPPYAAVTNYGYHLDALKFSQLLQRHCTQKLMVNHIIGHIATIENDGDGYINAIITDTGDIINGDLFVDCSGSHSLLLGQHYGVGLISQKHVLFNDSALAVQVPYPAPNSAIESATLSTAQSAGWVWDIALPTRRGVGYTYSSAHISDEQAITELQAYLASSLGQEQAMALKPRKITFEPGYREKFWHKNCVAVGMSAGFIEPLEASALAMVELSAAMISEQLPRNRRHMAIISERFNQRFDYRWQRVIEFLKLHYVISQRQSSTYWQDHREQQSIPLRLQQLLALWRDQPPSRYDFTEQEEIFPSASYQYVLYGMGFKTHTGSTAAQFNVPQTSAQLIAQNKQQITQCLAGLPTNRALLSELTKEFNHE